MDLFETLDVTGGSGAGTLWFDPNMSASAGKDDAGSAFLDIYANGQLVLDAEGDQVSNLTEWAIIPFVFGQALNVDYTLDGRAFNGYSQGVILAGVTNWFVTEGGQVVTGLDLSAGPLFTTAEPSSGALTIVGIAILGWLPRLFGAWSPAKSRQTKTSESAGASLTRVHFVDGVTVGYSGNGTRTNRTLSIEANWATLRPS